MFDPLSIFIILAIFYIYYYKIKPTSGYDDEDRYVSLLYGPVVSRIGTDQRLNPEADVMAFHSGGDNLYNNIQTLEQPISRDPLVQKQLETPDILLKRSYGYANDEGQLPDGYNPPIYEFEETAMIRQDTKKELIY